MAEKKLCKYLAAGVLLLLTVGLCSGCGKETAGNGETTELFGSYTVSPAGVLRVVNSRYLQFYSREADSTVYLCNQAGCSHQDKTCSAYVEDLQTAFYYNDDLYYIQSCGRDGVRIIRANRYGENREPVGEVDVFPPSFTLCIDEDTLYFIGDKWNDGENASIRGLYAFRLSDGTFTAFPNIDTGYLISNVSDFLVSDRYIYTQYTTSNIDINDYFDADTGAFQGIDLKSVVYTQLLYRTDRKSGETEFLIKEEGKELSVLEAEGESYILRLQDSILRYEGKEPVETLYTYSGDTGYWAIKPLGEKYLIWERLQECKQFRILENFTETGCFTDPDGEVNDYIGAVGDTIYFGGNIGDRGTLYYMEMEDFDAGNYIFHYIDIN